LTTFVAVNKIKLLQCLLSGYYFPVVFKVLGREETFLAESITVKKYDIYEKWSSYQHHPLAVACSISSQKLSSQDLNLLIWNICGPLLLASWDTLVPLSSLISFLLIVSDLCRFIKNALFL